MAQLQWSLADMSRYDVGRYEPPPVINRIQMPPGGWGKRPNDATSHSKCQQVGVASLLSARDVHYLDANTHKHANLGRGKSNLPGHHGAQPVHGCHADVVPGPRGRSDLPNVGAPGNNVVLPTPLPASQVPIAPNDKMWHGRGCSNLAGIGIEANTGALNEVSDCMTDNILKPLKVAPRIAHPRT